MQFCTAHVARSGFHSSVWIVAGCEKGPSHQPASGLRFYNILRRRSGVGRLPGRSHFRRQNRECQEQLLCAQTASRQFMRPMNFADRPIDCYQSAIILCSVFVGCAPMLYAEGSRQLRHCAPATCPVCRRKSAVTLYSPAMPKLIQCMASLFPVVASVGLYWLSTYFNLALLNPPLFAQIDAKPSVPNRLGPAGSRPRSKKVFVGGLAAETTEGTGRTRILMFHAPPIPISPIELICHRSAVR